MTANRSGRHGVSGRLGVLVGAVLIALAGVGWFVLSHNVMGTAAVDALGEAAGVVLALLVVASVVGAITSGRGSPR